ncbi:MAG TPA: hypothetical protein VHM23_17790 [Actinomycetota bacterium]|jgi:hypothetical protein|nr:hypothetical protein [Actinomycetota bacterium]
MSRTYRALTTLALSLALVATTAAAAVAAADLSEAREALYQSELEHNQAARAARAEAAVELARAGEREFAAAQSAAPAEDQSDRLLRGIEAAAAQRTQAAVEQARAAERNLGPQPVVTIAAQPVPAATGRDVDPIAIALLALVGGLIGGAAWTAASRRRPNRTVAA